MNTDTTFARALTAALRMLETSDRTEAEVRERLRRQGFAEETIADVVIRLRERRFLDDSRVVERQAERAQTDRPIGKERLRHELMKRGAGEDLVNKVIEEIDAESEMARATQLLQLRYSPDDSWSRAARFLARRGFDEETVLEAVRRFFPNVDAE